MKAHQRIIREQKAIAPMLELFPPPANPVLADAVIKQISYTTAERVILEYEWLRCMPAIVMYCYGIYFDDVLGGVVVYSQEYSENLGVWDKYGYTGKMLLLSRGACVHWTPTGTASKLIRKSMELLPPQYKVITATVDELAGEIGTIYQACGFHYVGVMRETKTRLGIRVNGKLIGTRAMRARFGTEKLDILKQAYPNMKIETQVSKARYFCFRGSVKEKKQHYKAIAHLIKQYPKRAEYVSRAIRANSISEGVVQFRDSALQDANNA